MSGVMMRLCALCLCAWLSDQLLSGSRLAEGIQLILGLSAAAMMLEAVAALPGALAG